MKVLLTFAKSSSLKGGTEVFSGHLHKVFPDLNIMDFKDTGDTGFKSSLFKEPLMAKSVCKHFLKTIKGQKPEAIFTNGMFGWYLKDLGVPIINIQHGGYAAFADSALKRRTLNYWRIRYIYSHFEKLSAKRSSIVISNSKFTKNNIKKYYGIESEVIYNCIDTEVFKPLKKEKARSILNLPENKKTAIFVGRPDYTKGFDILEKLAYLRKDILFICVLNPHVEARHGNIRIFSGIEQKKLNVFYSAADFLVYPSRFEGFGYVPLEALACNTPVIANKTGILTEISAEGIFTVNGNKPESYIKQIDEIPEKIDSNHYIRKKFSFGHFSDEHKRILKSINLSRQLK